MTRVIRLLTFLSATVTLTACLDASTIVKVKPDGSGTVEQTMLVNTAALKGIMPGAEKPAGPVLNQADLERMAQRMGKGVKLVSSETIKGANGFEGTKAIYSFDDINEIQVSQEPSMSGSTSGRLSTEPTNEDPVKFKLTRSGGTSTLSINYIDRAPAGTVPDRPGDAAQTPDLSNPMIMNMLKTMFQGFKVNIGLEVVGSIVKTNAEYVAGPRITLLELDVTTLLQDEAKLKALTSKLQPGMTLSEVRPLLKDMNGVKIDGPSITVEVR
jgi:hypothetical protein